MRLSDLEIPTSNGRFITRGTDVDLKSPAHPEVLRWSILAKLFFIGIPMIIFSLLGLMAYFSSLHSNLTQLPTSLILTKPTTYLILVEAIIALGLTGYLWFVWVFRVPAENCVSWMIKKADEKD